MFFTQVPRTCKEYADSGTSIRSGYYFIDPDGVGVGEPAIKVMCNMETGQCSVDVEKTLLFLLYSSSQGIYFDHRSNDN
jgi:hypothetical protein